MNRNKQIKTTEQRSQQGEMINMHTGWSGIRQTAMAKTHNSIWRLFHWSHGAAPDASTCPSSTRLHTRAQIEMHAYI